MVINVLDTLNAPGRYEDKYGQYLELFRKCAESKESLILENVPHSWVPFIEYIGNHKVLARIEYFKSCPVVASMYEHYETYHDKRQFVEVVSTFRPELVDSLWKYDMQWQSRNKDYQPRMPQDYEILITNNGSYHRREILNYFNHLIDYKPKKKNIILVPCAADKPYPAPMHTEVLKRMPEDFYLCNLTGVLGLVPQDLWPVMPLYDSGIPNEWRLINVATQYFKKHEHERIVVYCDFYSIPLKVALEQAQVDPDIVSWVNPCQFYHDYLDLMDKERLENLADTMLEE